MTILDHLQLTDAQSQAATASGNVVVTAGAGSGKTRTLVGRYLALLEAGVPLRGIVAITFTVKAAREMRTRVRRAIAAWLRQASDSPRCGFWESAFSELDAAHIGTIHSLCAQILREHPVETARLGLMPRFGVLEEGHAEVLRTRAVDEALARAAADGSASDLFNVLGESETRRAIAALLGKRLDSDAAFERVAGDPQQGWATAVHDWLGGRIESPQWRALLTTLAGLRAEDPKDRMEAARQAVLLHAEAADAAHRQGDIGATLDALAAVRGATALGGRKGNWPGDTLAVARDAMRVLRSHFDEHLKPLADPGRPASWALDKQAAAVIGPLRVLYGRTLDLYCHARQAENAPDFDDLEAGALALLRDQAVRTVWKSKVQAVLVDEFQDTNERQRQIVYALTDPISPLGAQRAPPASLFVVGDEKQSIYRFRGADVTVFRRVQDDVARAGGRTVVLDLTFRGHRTLVETLNRLLAPILGEYQQPGRPFAVPFAPLTAYRSDARAGIVAPFVELLLGLGQPALTGRRAAAAGLATRLLQLGEQERVDWKDVAMLFRASTAFSVYEDALERAGIPFVTVAGSGFYDRAEVRHLLNALEAVADPTDDLAMVGLLRSPFIGLTDVALYLLRFPPISVVPRDSHTPCSVWSSLNHPAMPEIVPPGDEGRATRGRGLILELHEMVGRVPVAVLIKRLLDRTHYRAALELSGGGGRARRNVDKLLADAHTSGLVSVSEFLEYVRTLRDVGARESEAPTEAGSAVQLMTVHKAKGLEFPVVVIADAAHAGGGGSAQVLLDAQLGVTISLRDRRGDDRRRPAAHQLAMLRNSERDEAENRRLLYVAATRAREKLLVNAHTKLLSSGLLSTSGWLRLLGQVVGLDNVSVDGTPVEGQELSLTPDVGCRLYPWRGEQASDSGAEAGTQSVAQTVSRDLLVSLVTASPRGDPKLMAREARPPRRVWRVLPVTKAPRAPAWVIGTLIHAALRHWRFGDEGLDALLRPIALDMGVVDERRVHAAVLETARLLRRFRAHPFWATLNAARRWHELPFSVIEDGRPENGVIDLLYRINGEWSIAEFKSDRLPIGANLVDRIREEGYDDQVLRYARAVRSQLSVEAGALIVFLNVGSGIAVVPVAETRRLRAPDRSKPSL